MTNGDEVQFKNDFGLWVDAKYVGTTSKHRIVIELVDNTITSMQPNIVRLKPKTQSICVMVYRDPHTITPLQIYTLQFETEGTARVYAFDRQLNVIKYITVEIPQ